MEVVPRRTNMMSPSMSWLHGSSSPRSSSFGNSSLRNTLRRQQVLGESRSLPALQNLANSAAASGSHGVAAAIASSVLSQTAKGFLASYDQRLSQSFWGHNSSLGKQISPEKRRLAPVASRAARRENFKKERYATTIDRIVDQLEPQEDNRSSAIESNPPKQCVANIRQSKIVRSSFEKLETAVKKGAKVDEVVNLLNNASEKHRNFNPNESLKRKEREARDAKLREEKESGFAILSSHSSTNLEQPSNARWRVEEKLKKERQLLKESSPPKNTQRIPMTQYAAQGEKGREEFAMVDVKAIQNKCRSLSNCSAKSLLELQRFKERQAAEAETSKKDLEHRVQAYKPELQALAALDWEQRLELAQLRKLEGHVTTVFNKMATMRSKYPKAVPDSIENHLQAMKLGDFSWHLEN